jgi:hypothetical protein
MVPTEFMEVAISMFANASAQLLHFGNELFVCHLVEV